MLFALTFTKGCESRTRFFLLTFRHTLTAVRRGVVDVRGRADFRADLTLARRGPTLATLVRPQSEDLFVEGKTFLRDAACGRTLADLTLARSRL